MASAQRKANATTPTTCCRPARESEVLPGSGTCQNSADYKISARGLKTAGGASTAAAETNAVRIGELASKTGRFAMKRTETNGYNFDIQVQIIIISKI